jgi:hypothetical protein
MIGKTDIFTGSSPNGDGEIHNEKSSGQPDDGLRAKQIKATAFDRGLSLLILK